MLEIAFAFEFFKLFFGKNKTSHMEDLLAFADLTCDELDLTGVLGAVFGDECDPELLHDLSRADCSDKRDVQVQVLDIDVEKTTSTAKTRRRVRRRDAESARLQRHHIARTPMGRNRFAYKHEERSFTSLKAAIAFCRALESNPSDVKG